MRELARNLLLAVCLGSSGVFVNWAGNQVPGRPGSALIGLSAVLMLAGVMYLVAVLLTVLMDEVAL